MFNFSPEVKWKDGLIKTLLWYKDYYLNNDKRYFEEPNKYYN